VLRVIALVVVIALGGGEGMLEEGRINGVSNQAYDAEQPAG
jgi:hypothetical protein